MHAISAKPILYLHLIKAFFTTYCSTISANNQTFCTWNSKQLIITHLWLLHKRYCICIIWAKQYKLLLNGEITDSLYTTELVMFDRRIGQDASSWAANSLAHILHEGCKQFSILTELHSPNLQGYTAQMRFLESHHNCTIMSKIFGWSSFPKWYTVQLTILCS